MRLNTQTDYALRTLMYLATHRRRAKIADVARLFGISANHVAKVVNQLSRMGYVHSIRGIGGGMELARSPGEIVLGDVITAFEGDMHLLSCVGTDEVCTIQSFCRLKGVLAEAERVQIEYLSTKTLQDVVPTRRQLAQVEV